jgi:hypothetical protein
VLALVQDEFVIIMRQAGTLDISAINGKYLTSATRPVRALGTDSGRKYDLADWPASWSHSGMRFPSNVTDDT